jgi:hypothetical protein
MPNLLLVRCFHFFTDLYLSLGLENFGFTGVNGDWNIVAAEKALRHEDLQEAPLLIFANKQVEVFLSVI